MSGNIRIELNYYESNDGEIKRNKKYNITTLFLQKIEIYKMQILKIIFDAFLLYRHLSEMTSHSIQKRML